MKNPKILFNLNDARSVCLPPTFGNDFRYSHRQKDSRSEAAHNLVETGRRRNFKILFFPSHRIAENGTLAYTHEILEKKEKGLPSIVEIKTKRMREEGTLVQSHRCSPLKKYQTKIESMIFIICFYFVWIVKFVVNPIKLLISLSSSFSDSPLLQRSSHQRISSFHHCSAN